MSKTTTAWDEDKVSDELEVEEAALPSEAQAQAQAREQARAQLTLEAAAIAGQIAYVEALRANLDRDRNTLVRRAIEIELALRDTGALA